MQDPFSVDYLFSEEEEVARAVRHLRLNRENRMSVMMADHLWDWPRAATREEFLDPSQWEMYVGPIQADFHEVHLAEDYA